jgi:hypothetical protein
MKTLFISILQLGPFRRTFHLGYKNKSVYYVSGTSRCLFSDNYKTTMWAERTVIKMFNCWCITWPVDFKRLTVDQSDSYQLAQCHERFFFSKVASIRLGVPRVAVVWDTALQAVSSRVRFPVVSLEFFIDIILPVALWPWGRLSLLLK